MSKASAFLSTYFKKFKRFYGRLKWTTLILLIVFARIFDSGTAFVWCFQDREDFITTEQNQDAIMSYAYGEHAGFIIQNLKLVGLFIFLGLIHKTLKLSYMAKFWFIYFSFMSLFAGVTNIFWW